uniref:Uncharacterized protein n=1 Tax=uncultured marine thaumarchaeote SAT1000_10_F12 TaxID=1456373 RepID=A0A075I4E8_9ARCH|nr:hypothetical protein [uncultured marine thaumarchaeote SAT1000_10_F12]
MKNTTIFLSLFTILVILPCFDQVLAAPSISIETSQDVYAYGDHLVMIINVSEITGDDGYIYITDPAERKVYFYSNQFHKNMLNSHQTFLLILLYGKLVHMH